MGVWILVLGLVIFLGLHSVRIVAEDWRTATRARMGEGPFKGVYSLVSIAGFALIVWGFGLARQQPVVLWSPPAGLRHLNSLFTLIAFILLAAAYVPRNGIKSRLRHPMILGTKVWALGHLLASGYLSSVILFGSFLVWAVLCFRAARGRDRAAGTVYAAGSTGATVATVVVGLVAWAAFTFWAHGLLIGVRPIPMGG